MAADSANIFTDLQNAKDWGAARSLPPSFLQELDRMAQDQKNAEDNELIRYVFHNLTYFEKADPRAADVQTACLLSTRTRDALYAGPYSLFPLPPAVESEPPAFIIDNCPKKAMANDKGMFAAREILPGDVIAVERPLIVAPILMWLNSPPGEKGEIYHRLFERLPAALRERAKGMKNGKKGYGVEEGILRTNGIAVDLGDSTLGGSLHTALFENTGRCNHR
jgi:hypothetical protein